MGEYAKFSGQEIKIGTCESMYYLRYDDRHRVQPLPNNLNPATETGLFFRLPFPDEDDQHPGSYTDYKRGYRLWSPESRSNWQPEDLDEYDSGTIQLTHDCGLLVNVPCHHGAKLPDVGNAKAFWNGKSWHLELCSVKSMPGGVLRPVYHCRHCQSMWSTEWDEILPYCGLDKEMLRRLEGYANLGAALT